MPASFYFKIVAKHSGKCLDVAGFSRDNEAPVIQWEYLGGDNQKWSLIEADLSANQVLFRSKLSEKYLDIFSPGRGAPVIQNEHTGTWSQRWVLETVPGEPNYYRIRNLESTRYLDVGGVSPANGAAITQWEWLNGDNQKWQLVVAEIIDVPY